MANRPKQLTIEERWAMDNEEPDFGIGVKPATPESLAMVAWFREQDAKKKKDKK